MRGGAEATRRLAGCNRSPLLCALVAAIRNPTQCCRAADATLTALAGGAGEGFQTRGPNSKARMTLSPTIRSQKCAWSDMECTERRKLTVAPLYQACAVPCARSSDRAEFGLGHL